MDTTLNRYDGQDMGMISRLLKNPRYEIPEHLRQEVVSSAASILKNPDGTPQHRLAAAKIILEADKRNLEIVKMVVPKMNINFNAKDLTDEQLQAMGREMSGLLNTGSR